MKDINVSLTVLYIPSLIEIGLLVPEKKIFEGFSPYQGRLRIKFGFDQARGFREEGLILWRYDDGRSPEHGYTISPPMSLRLR